MKTKTERRNLLNRKVYRFFLVDRVPGYKKPRKECRPVVHSLVVGVVEEVVGNKDN